MKNQRKKSIESDPIDSPSLGAGNAYGQRGEANKACDYYKNSLVSYNRAKQRDGNFKEPQMLTGCANMGELIKAFISKEGCGI